MRIRAIDLKSSHCITTTIIITINTTAESQLKKLRWYIEYVSK